MVSASFVKGKMAPPCQKGWVRTWSKVESKLGPSMLRNKIGPSFDLKMVVFFLLVLFLWKSHSHCRKKKIIKKNTKNKEELDQVLTQKSYFWTKFDSTVYIYIYVAVVLLSGPSLVFWGVIIWAKLFFTKHCLSKNTIQIGASALFW